MGLARHLGLPKGGTLMAVAWVVCLGIALSPLRAASFEDTPASRSHPCKEWLKRWGMFDLLVRRDLVPFEFGMEREYIEQVEPQTLSAEAYLKAKQEKRAQAAQSTPKTSPSLTEAPKAPLMKKVRQMKTIRQYAREQKSEPRWEPMGPEAAFGTHIENPETMAGLVVRAMAGVDQSGDGVFDFYEMVVGKVLSVEAKVRDVQDPYSPKYFEVTLLTLDGKREIHLPGAHEVERLYLPTISKIKIIVQKVKTLVEKIWMSGTLYFQEVHQNKERLVFKPRDLLKERMVTGKGFYEWQEPRSSALGRILYWLPHPEHFLTWAVYRVGQLFQKPEHRSPLYPTLTPVVALNQWIYRPTMGMMIRIMAWVGQKAGVWRSEQKRNYLSRPLELTHPMNLVLGTVLFVQAYHHFNEWNENLLIRHRREVIHEQQDRFLDLIERRPFLSRVKQKMEQLGPEQYTPLEAVEEAYLRLDALDAYYFHYHHLHDPLHPLDSFREILSEPSLNLIFPATIYLMEQGPKPNAHFTIPPHELEPADEEELLSLMHLNHDVFRHMAVRSLLSRPYEELKHTLEQVNDGEHELIPVFKSLVDDPYIEALFFLWKRGKIDEERLNYLLLEDIQWKEKFKRWEIFEAKRLLPSGEVLNLEWVRQARLRHFEKSFGELEQLSLVDIYPSEAFDNTGLLDDYSHQMTQVHVLRRTAPYLRRIGWLRPYARSFAKGRMKKLATGDRFRSAHVITRTGELASSGAKVGMLSEGMGVLSRALIGFDALVRINQYENIEIMVSQAGGNPFLHEEIEKQPHVQIDYLIEGWRIKLNRLEQLAQSDVGREELGELIKNPYLQYLKAQNILEF